MLYTKWVSLSSAVHKPKGALNKRWLSSLFKIVYFAQRSAGQVRLLLWRLVNIKHLSAQRWPILGWGRFNKTICYKTIASISLNDFPIFFSLLQRILKATNFEFWVTIFWQICTQTRTFLEPRFIPNARPTLWQLTTENSCSLKKFLDFMQTSCAL